MAPIVSVADLFMALMLSRPGGLSLRNSWVTPASLWLSALSTLVALLLAGVLIHRGGVPSWLGAAALVILAVGSAAVVAVGVAQRRSPHR
jgi:hypothetical protein